MFKNWSVGKMLAAAFVSVIAVALVLAGMAANTLNRLKVGGPIYQGIVQRKDLIGDVLRGTLNRRIDSWYISTALAG